MQSDTLVCVIGEPNEMETKYSKITRKMQKYYWGVIIKSILEYNKETGIIVNQEINMEVDDEVELDYILRYYFYYQMVNINGVEIRMPKPLKLSKANRVEVCRYMDKVIRYMSTKELYIPTSDEDWWKNVLDK